MSDKHSEQEAKVIELRLAAAHRAGAIEACRELAASFRMCAGDIAELSPHRVNAEQTYEHCARLADDIAARYAEPEEEKKG